MDESNGEGWWWLSYAVPGECRGVCIVYAPDMVSAVATAARKGISPGGQVVGFLIPPPDSMGMEPDRLYHPDEIPEDARGESLKVGRQ